MAVTYTYAVRYEVEALCRTPLRAGGTDSDPQTVLESWDGTALLQGSSLAGALRGWLAAADAGMAETLFGSQKQAGHLMVSDGVFDRTAERHIRPRLDKSFQSIDKKRPLSAFSLKSRQKNS